MWQAYNEEYGAAGDVMKQRLDMQVQSLITWIERKVFDLKFPELAKVDHRRLYLHKEQMVEVVESVFQLPMVAANPGLMSKLDERIVQGYRDLKAGGFKRPSWVIACHFFLSMLSPKRTVRYEEMDGCWAATELVRQRLESTARVAIRYQYHEEYGPRVTEKEGETLFEYGPGPWRRILEKRGVVAKKGRPSAFSQGSKAEAKPKAKSKAKPSSSKKKKVQQCRLDL
jgi:hypothetical protein